MFSDTFIVLVLIRTKSKTTLNNLCRVNHHETAIAIGLTHFLCPIIKKSIRAVQLTNHHYHSQLCVISAASNKPVRDLWCF